MTRTIRYEDLDKFVDKVIATLNFGGYVGLESLIKAIEQLGGKINFIDDPRFVICKDVYNVYPIHCIDSDNFEFNVYISGYPENETNALEKVKTYRTAFTLGVFLLLDGSGRKDLHWESINGMIRNMYGSLESSLKLRLFLENSNPGLFAKLLLMQNAKMEEFVSVYYKIKDNSEKQRAIEDLANNCNVPFSVAWSRFADMGFRV